MDESETITIGVAILITGVLLLQYLSRKEHDLPFPQVGSRHDLDIRAALSKGAKEYPNTPWVLPLADPIVIIPRWAANEIKSLPEKKISLNKEIYIRMLGRFTLMGEDDDEMVGVIKHDLTRSLPSLFPQLIDEAKFSIKEHFMSQNGNEASNGELLSVFENVALMVALLSGRIFVGLPLSRDKDWLHSSIAYTSDGVTVAESPLLKPYTTLIRYLMAPFLPQVRSLKRHQAVVKEKIKPLIAAHLKSLDNGIKSETASSGKFLDWLLARYNYRVDDARIARDYILASAGAIPIAAGLLTQVLLELALRSDCVDSLRLELETIVDHDGWTFAALSNLEHMDSFIKECQRLNPHVFTMMPRRTMAPIHLSNGNVLPKGVSVAVSNHAINTSPEIYPNPDEFQPDRFFNLKYAHEGKSESKYQLTTSTLDSMNFGYGTHTCPGRQFAGVELKICVAYMLSNFDLLPTHEGKIENLTFGIVQVPNPATQLYFRPRSPIRGLEL